MKLKHLKIIMAALLLLCLVGGLPYGFFVLVRFIAMVAFGVMAYQYYKNNRSGLAVVFGVLALLFQPFAKIALSRGVWNVVDVIVAIVLIVLWSKERETVA